MNIDAKLVEKTFTTKDTGEVRKYYAIELPLVDGTNLEVTLKSDKAKIFLMSEKLKQQGK